MLYFDGCPSHGPAGEGIEARVDAVAVNTGVEARRLRFPGSPTIRRDGEDLLPASGALGPEDWGMRCRVYGTPEGLKGSPTEEMFRTALRRTQAADRTRPPEPERA